MQFDWDKSDQIGEREQKTLVGKEPIKPVELMAKLDKKSVCIQFVSGLFSRGLLSLAESCWTAAGTRPIIEISCWKNLWNDRWKDHWEDHWEDLWRSSKNCWNLPGPYEKNLGDHEKFEWAESFEHKAIVRRYRVWWSGDDLHPQNSLNKLRIQAMI